MRTGLFVVSMAMLSACAVVPSPAFHRTAADVALPQDQAASGKYGPEPGESLVQFGGALTSQNQTPGNDSTSILLQRGIGWFQNDWLEIGGQLISDWSLQSGPDTVLVSVAPYVNGNYKIDPRLWLYGGPHLGLAYLNFGSDNATTIEYGLHGGARYWVDPRTSVFGELRYTHATFDISSVDIDNDTVQLLFGFSVVF